jgi:hypothetical protein
MAHELAHSIDDFPADPSSGLSNLGVCLRQLRSMGLSMRSSPDNYKLMDPQSERETFCEWMGAEVLARLSSRKGHILNRNQDEMIQGVTNAANGCSPDRRDDLIKQTVHGARIYLNELVASQPELRRRMGCTNRPQLVYCPLTDSEKLGKESTEDYSNGSVQ